MNPEQNPNQSSAEIWGFSDDRLADLGALMVFRHWLRSLLNDQAQAKADASVGNTTPSPEAEPRYSRLFF